ncbi:MAG: diguanylate cyclase, partial [Campylobacterota bacterium]|nr:diguanylate cyclase [Campylobacterota bacterium]
THVSGALLELSGYTQSELVGKNVSIFRSGQTKEETYKELWSCTSQGKEWRGELQNSRKDESFYWVSLYITPLFGKDGSIHGYNSLQTDISAMIAAQSQAVRDSLTALYNRVLFNETLENMINISKRGNMHLSFLMLDIDHFKLYNDTYGHSHGDKALTSVGKVLKTYVSRVTDYAFRLGGEEFALIIVGLDEAKSLALANRVRESIIDLKIEHEKNTVHRYLSVSIGLYCTKGLKIDNAEFIYAQADNALYQSKRDRRNSVTIFNGKG